MIKRYKTTYGTFNMPEVYFVAVTLIKVAILLPNYFIHEMNTFYYVFCMNSLCSYFLTYILTQRTCVLLGLGLKKLWWNKVGFIAQILLFLVATFVSPLLDKNDTNSYTFIIHCTDLVYRKYLTHSLHQILPTTCFMMFSTPLPFRLWIELCQRLCLHHNHYVREAIFDR